MNLRLKIILAKVDKELESLVRSILRESLQPLQLGMELTHLGDYPAIDCFISLRKLQWTDIFQTLKYIKGHIEEVDIQVLQLIIGEDSPSFQLLNEYRGIWISPRYVGDDLEFLTLLEETNARWIEQRWLLLPFTPTEFCDDSDYEMCLPDDKIRKLGTRVNTSDRRTGVPVGFRVRMAEGQRLSDYVTTAFEDTLKTQQNFADTSNTRSDLGGLNIILTTLLQMNDKLPLVNHYSEKLRHSEDLNLYSLSAMNLSPVDERDENNIAVLVSSGKLIIEEIKLGG